MKASKLPRSVVYEQTRQMAQSTDYKLYLRQALGHLPQAQRDQIERSYERVYLKG